VRLRKKYANGRCILIDFAEFAGWREDCGYSEIQELLCPYAPVLLSVLWVKRIRRLEMVKAVAERRLNQRYSIHLPIHFRVSQKGATSRWGTGVTCDISSNGVSFRCRRPLPVGAHVEMIVDWPARYDENHPIDLQATGFVVRSTATRAAVRMTSRRFRIELEQAQPMGATA
jgi:hypothetical protein